MSDSMWVRSPLAVAGNPSDRDSGKASAPASGGDFSDSTEDLLRVRYKLTPRELQVALLLVEGLSYREIAETLKISFHTVNSHVTAVRSKTGVPAIRKLPALLRRAR